MAAGKVANAATGALMARNAVRVGIFRVNIPPSVDYRANPAIRGRPPAPACGRVCMHACPWSRAD